MKTSELVPGEMYSVVWRVSQRRYTGEGVLKTVNGAGSGWHQVEIKKITGGSSYYGRGFVGKTVSISSTGMVKRLTHGKVSPPPPPKAPVSSVATKQKTAREAKKAAQEREALVLMLAKFKIEADVMEDGLFLPDRMLTRLRRVLVKMFGKQLGL